MKNSQMLQGTMPRSSSNSSGSSNSRSTSTSKRAAAVASAAAHASSIAAGTTTGRIRAAVASAGFAIAFCGSYDVHLNLVLANAEETLTVVDENNKLSKTVRKLPLIFVRGDAVVLLSPLNDS
ncbi:LSM domain-containing protein, putative [Eimeria maxima]|uniref:LSM domain-containing protein, putative n=1 Tax=Eimeria maxima TaxID=5804 RepID=U6MCX7_EIMMA|nr:LSM domain-containing protein, putative [Eimeria maxima]CDJ60314.1 LSM domain-containing protein, putative [Eimeria maxima]